jgi:hypothetical protein
MEDKKMKTKINLVVLMLCLGAVVYVNPVNADDTKDWSINFTIIEACSCPMFCQCYFNTKPASHSHGMGMSEHYCRFNNAYRVNSGHYGDVKLEGVKFWAAGDLGDDFGDGDAEWIEITFDPSVTKEQREAVAAILPTVYPIKWKTMTIAEDKTIEWTAGKDRSVAKLDDGKAGEVVLVRYQGLTDEPIVIKNLRYFGEAKNDGFILMPNEVEAYRIGDKKFEFRGTNGFMITIDANSSMSPEK